MYGLARRFFASAPPALLLVCLVSAAHPAKILTPAADAAAIIDGLSDTVVPASIRGLGRAELEARWPRWIRTHDAEIRARLDRGDEDSVANFLLLGTSFTAAPLATRAQVAKLAGKTTAAELVRKRLDDLVAALQSPRLNERLQFARSVVERQGIDLTTVGGRTAARDFLMNVALRMLGEIEKYDKAADAANAQPPNVDFAIHSTMYRDRGLSSDTSIFADFGVERALAVIAAEKLLTEGGVGRAAVVGPGLDFTDKHDGYDFYPQQTVQPFALVDSLNRLHLAKPHDFQITTFDVSPRINGHLQAARGRARAGHAYTIQLPRDKGVKWTAELVRYWSEFGGTIGEPAKAIAPPPQLADVLVRAVRIWPAKVLAVTPEDLDIVAERLPLPDDEAFDLIVGTNVFLYYDVFDQSLALANIAAMLRPGGVLVTNNLLVEVPGVPMKSGGQLAVTYSSNADGGDTFVWYLKK
jgi:hypothetical protein